MTITDPIPTLDVDPPREAALMAATGSQLEQLCAMYDQLKVRADAAKREFEALKTAIKVELQNQAPDSAKVTLQSAHLARPLVRTARCEHRIDSEALRTKEPALAEQFTKEIWSWRLEAQR
jgi:hypothetical protein